jgi:tRNA pseudouridine65 synthase
VQFRILFQDDSLVAIDKPAGFHVHPPEDKSIRVDVGSTCVVVLRRQLGREVYPAHRLDRPTSGVLLFALDPLTARAMSERFGSREVSKTYYAVTRGWITGDEEQLIDRPLSSESGATTMEARTRIEPLARIELPHAVGRYATARYTLVRAEPETGRLHQIRRHLAGISHPIVGDTTYGDRDHNRFFRDTLNITPLLLKAQRLEFVHPRTDDRMSIESRWSGAWHSVFDRFGLCPLNPSTRRSRASS